MKTTQQILPSPWISPPPPHWGSAAGTSFPVSHSSVAAQPLLQLPLSLSLNGWF